MSVRTRARLVFWSTPIGVLTACLLAAVVIGGGAALIFVGGGSAPRAATAVLAPVRASSSGCSLPAGGQDVSSLELSPPSDRRLASGGEHGGSRGSGDARA